LSQPEKYYFAVFAGAFLMAGFFLPHIRRRHSAGTAPAGPAPSAEPADLHQAAFMAAALVDGARAGCQEVIAEARRTLILAACGLGILTAVRSAAVSRLRRRRFILSVALI
jgi:hypothetical protein